LPRITDGQPQASLEDIQVALDEFVQSEQRPQVLSLADVRAAVTKRLDRLDSVDSHLLSMYHSDAMAHALPNLDEAQVFLDAPWRRSLVATDGNRAYVPDAPPDIPRFRESAEKLRQLFHTNYYGGGASAGARQRMDEACDRLALDLALSSHTFVTSRPGVQSESIEGGHDEPAADFLFLRPSRPKDGGKGTDDDATASRMVASDAARHLVGDWTVGVPFPRDYVFENPYGEADAGHENEQFEAYRSRIALGKDISASQPVTARQHDDSQDPQTTFASYFAGSAVRRPDDGHVVRVDKDTGGIPALRHTQPEALGPSTSSQISPALPAFSQIVPGVHANRKPPKKKRLGGF
jgi:RNA polymerase I-specific transcription-initiation factor